MRLSPPTEPERRYYGRTSFVRWVVPLSDEATMCIAWAVFGDRADPPEYNTPEGPELIEQGELFDRSDEEKKLFPADAEATESMGTITEHEKEHLVPSDRGIVGYRKRLRSLVRDLQKGTEPVQVTEGWSDRPIPTYGGDTVLHIPANGSDDGAMLRAVGEAVMEAQFDAEGLPEDERVEAVVRRLKQIEVDERVGREFA